MTHDDRSTSEPGSTESSSTAASGSIRDRVQTLREKASDLSETFDKVEKTLQEAERETKD